MNKDEIILMVKKAISANISFSCADGEGVILESNDVDHTAEEVYEALYNAGYRKTFTSDFASDTQKAFKEGYEKGCEACAQSWDNGYNDCYESGKEDGVKEFAVKVKDYINDKVVEEFYDMAVDVQYLTIDIDEFEEYVDELLAEIIDIKQKRGVEE